MLKLNFVRRSLAFVEVVHIELTNEGIQIVMFEICRERLIGKTIPIQNLEAEAIFAPLDNTALRRVIDDFEQFLEEGRNRFLLSLAFLAFIHC